MGQNNWCQKGQMSSLFAFKGIAEEILVLSFTQHVLIRTRVVCMVEKWQGPFACLLPSISLLPSVAVVECLIKSSMSQATWTWGETAVHCGDFRQSITLAWNKWAKGNVISSPGGQIPTAPVLSIADLNAPLGMVGPMHSGIHCSKWKILPIIEQDF